MLQIEFMNNACEIAFRWIPPNIFDDKWTLVQVMAFSWWHQAITWANVDPNLSRHMASLGHNELTLNTYQHIVA